MSSSQERELSPEQVEDLVQGLRAGAGVVKSASAAWERMAKGAGSSGRWVSEEEWRALGEEILEPLAPMAGAWVALARAGPAVVEGFPEAERNLARRASWLVRALSGDSLRLSLNDRIQEAQAKTLHEEVGDLAEEQAKAAVLPAKAGLVLAPAGSGKTRVLSSRATWLIRTKAAKPSEILLVCFGRAAAQEMHGRIVKKMGKTGKGVAACTFHALGRYIIEAATGRALPIHQRTTDENIEGTIQGILLQACRDDPQFLDEVAGLLAFRSGGEEGVSMAPMHGFTHARDWTRAVRGMDLISLSGDRLPTSEDRTLADTLVLLGVPFQVEEMPEGKESRWPGAVLVLEGGRAMWTRPETPRGESVKWMDPKRLQHALSMRRERYLSHAEIPSWTLADGITARSAAKDALSDLRISLDPSPDGVFRLLGGPDGEGGGNAPIARLRRTLTAWIRLWKSGAAPEDEVRERLEASPSGRRFLPVAERVFARYEAMLFSGARYGPEGLQEEGREEVEDGGVGVDARATVDFADYLDLAAGLVRDGSFRSPWREIMVDEAQDMLPGAIGLLKALQSSREETRMFAVGDDWQSIFSWSGADEAVLSRFSERFGPGASTAVLSMSYRCAPDAAGVAAGFMLRNPSQTRREVRGIEEREKENPSIGVRLPWAGIRPTRDRRLLRDAVVDAVLDLALKGEEERKRREEREPGKKPKGEKKKEEKPSVLVLSRYRATPAAMGFPDGIHSPGPDGAWAHLDVSWTTVHGAKGLEADHCLVLEVARGSWGFPSSHQDDAVLELLKSDPDPFPHAAERRLFYVALTRARMKTCVMSLRGRPSRFLEEIAADSRTVLEGWSPDGGLPEEEEERHPVWCASCSEQPRLVSAEGLLLRWCPGCGARHQGDLEALRERLEIDDE